jgi:hypothetical protein
MLCEVREGPIAARTNALADTVLDPRLSGFLSAPLILFPVALRPGRMEHVLSAGEAAPQQFDVGLLRPVPLVAANIAIEDFVILFALLNKTVSQVDPMAAAKINRRDAGVCRDYSHFIPLLWLKERLSFCCRRTKRIQNLLT